jgi:CO dehydrogenase/acetyl-CoA synthase beta subunit
MNPFDPYFALIRDYVKDLRDRGRTTRFWTSMSVEDADGSTAGHSQGIILMDETAVELGGPRAASSTFVLWTNDLSLISDGTTTLVGPDIPELQDTRPSFGQVTLLGGPTLGRDAQPRLERAVHAAERAPGYMARSTGGRIWSRVSRQAVRARFSFGALGSGILRSLSTMTPAIAASEIIFVTSSEDDVRALERIGAQVRKLAHDLRRERLRETTDGSYECENPVSCEACPDNDVCSEIREILVIRKG